MIPSHTRSIYKKRIETERLTKRKILGKVARIYDSIGFAAPIIIKAKTGLQKLWQSGYDWDEELPDGDEWRGLFREMSELNDISLERCLKPRNAQGNQSYVFSVTLLRLHMVHALI